MRNLTLTIAATFAATLQLFTATAQNSVKVSSDIELQEALKNKKNLSTIIIEDGEYKSFKFTVKSSGTADNPLTIKAETPGKVVVTDNALVRISGSNIVLSGIYFKDAFEKGEMDGGDPVIEITGDNVRVTQCAFVNCNNRASVASMYQSASDKMPQYTRIDHCYFADNLGWRLYLDLGNRVPSDDPKYAMYYRIDHNYFSTPYKMAANTGSAMRIGLGQLGLGRCLIDNNLFERQDGEVELIENKSHENVYINNTFRNCRSRMSFRQGRGIIFLHNQFEATDSKYRYCGLGMWMDDHIVAGNYFTMPYGSFLPLDKKINEREDTFDPAAVQFISGYKNFRHADKSYASHLAVQNSLVANNTFFDCSDPVMNLAYFKENLDRYKGYPTTVPFGNSVMGNVFAYSGKQHPELITNSDEAENKIEDNVLITPKTDAKPKYIEVKSKQLDYAQVWIETIPGVEKGEYDLNKLANSRVAEVKKSGKKVTIKRQAPHTFATVGPEWLKKNPSEFATCGEYTPELVKTIRDNVLGSKK